MVPEFVGRKRFRKTLQTRLSCFDHLKEVGTVLWTETSTPSESVCVNVLTRVGPGRENGGEERGREWREEDGEGGRRKTDRFDLVG